MFSPVRVSAPAVSPISLSEVKARLKVDHAEDDATILAYIEAATRRLDGWDGILGRCLINQAWELRLPDWPCGRRIILPFPHCSNISVSYSAAGAEQVGVPPDNVSPVRETIGGSSVLIFSSFELPLIDSEKGYVAVAFTAGYGAAASDVPPPIRQAIHLMVADMYRFTEGAVIGNAEAAPISTTVDNLIAPYRRLRV